ncbi:MAG: tetratricopeptide repeat protein [Candidatus Heimdallarchaeota archaeon]|nr:tetratricopeptide repeat protein [Candidatus Heimdallarchaeota archaeon]
MKLNLRNKIIITFLGSLLVGILILTVVNAIQISQFSNTSGDITYNAMEAEELSNLDRIASDKALLVYEYIRAVVTDINMAFEFADALFKGEISVDAIDSHWADSSIDPWVPQQDPNYDLDLFVSDYYGLGSAYWGASTIYLPNINNAAEYAGINQATQDLIDLSSALEYVFKSMHASNPDYIWIYMGFETGMFRQLPWNDMSWTHDEPGGNWDFKQNEWYTGAVQKDGLSILLDKDPESGLVISASYPVKDASDTLVGVISVDLPIDVVEAAISGDSIMENGYAFMTDKAGNALIHPKLVEDADLFGLDVATLEFSQNSEKLAFTSLLPTLTAEATGQSDFNKDEAKWYISYSDVGYGFSMFVVVPQTDIQAPAEEIKDNILAIFYQNIIVFVIIIAVIGGIIIYFTGKASRKIVDPVTELTQVTKMITNGNLSKDLRGDAAGSRELNVLYNTFKGLITALRFGNQDYYAGDINRAMANYQSALELFTTLNNKKGVGIALNNIANIHKARGDLKDANATYRDSIKIAEELLDNAVEADRVDLTVSLASRYNNIALLYKEIEEFDRAEQFLNKALDLDRKVDNARGFATRYGNLGLVFLEQDRIDEAKQSFDEAYSIAEQRRNDRALAYATMNYGYYHRHLGEDEEALEQFLKAVEMAEGMDIRVVTTSLRNVQEIYEEQGKVDLADAIEKQLQAKAGGSKPKEVTFVLDYSGSMSGKRIRNATQGILNIFNNQVNPKDLVSLIIFHSTYRVLIHPTLKEEVEREFINTVGNLTRPGGATAFYDALGHSMQDFIDRPSQKEQWVIALTDGDDNSSVSYSPYQIISQAQHSVGVNLVIIGVGELQHKQLIEEMTNNTDKGRYIDIADGVAESITTAFEEVSTMLSEIAVEGFVPDED